MCPERLVPPRNPIRRSTFSPSKTPDQIYREAPPVCGRSTKAELFDLVECICRPTTQYVVCTFTSRGQANHQNFSLPSRSSLPFRPGSGSPGRVSFWAVHRYCWCFSSMTGISVSLVRSSCKCPASRLTRALSHTEVILSLPEADK